MKQRIRPVLSEKNKYHIDKHRYYELKHFCLQYNEWKDIYESIDTLSVIYPVINKERSNNNRVDMTANCAIRKTYYSDKMRLIEETAIEADEDLCAYILKAVTEGLSYNYLKSRLGIPCSRDTYYDRYRRFFWLLSDKRK